MSVPPVIHSPHSEGDQPRGDELFEAMRRRILSGEWPVGERLPTERELAAELGTNRNTLREAMRRLESAKLVDAPHGRRARVLDFRRTGSCDLLGPLLRHGADPGEKARVLLDLLGPRARLAEIVAETATGRATAADLRSFDEAIERARSAEQARDTTALASAEVAWNDALVEATHNIALRWLANPYLAALADVLGTLAPFVLFEPSFADHASSVRGAIADRDVHAAVAATRVFHDAVDAKLRSALGPIASPTPAR